MIALRALAIVCLFAGAARAADCADVAACARACTERHDARACTRAGQWHRDGRATAVDPMAAVPLLQRGCALGAAEACYDLGDLVERGIGVRGAASDARALVLYDRACKLGDHSGCDMAAVLDERREAVFKKRAVGLHARQCAAGDAYACYLQSRDDTPDAARALAKSIALDEKGCAAGDRDACRRLAHEVDPARAGSLWRDALAADLRDCDAGAIDKCMGAASIYSLGASKFGMTPDLPRAAELFGRACAARWVAGCRAAASDLRQAHSSPDRMLDAACAAGDEESCDKLPDRASRALDLRARKCTDGNARACGEAAEQLRDGKGVPKDAVRAETFKRRACSLGARWICERR